MFDLPFLYFLYAMTNFKIAILASGSGSNAENIFNYFSKHEFIKVSLLLTNNADAFVIKRARRFNVSTKIFNKIEYRESTIILNWLEEYKITHIVLAGFLWLIPQYLIEAYPSRIINIHPALLPKFGGKGMYGIKVHEAVKLAGEKETGITIHLVNENYDEGEILFQGKCAVGENASPEEISQCVQLLEHQHYPRIIEEWILNG